MRPIVQLTPGLFLLLASHTYCCDITIPAGANAQTINTALLNYTDVCLATGTYPLGSTPITVQPGKTLEGVGATRSDTVLNSTAPNGAIALKNSAVVKNLTLSGPGGGPSAVYGVLVYQSSNSIIWGLDIHGFLINIGITGSPNTHVWSTSVSNNGDIHNGTPNPNMWINQSSSTEILYGVAYGRGDNKPFGDGAVSFYDSSGIHIYGFASFDSGTSAIYLVNCDNAVIENTNIYRAGGFGLDIVGGTDNFVSRNNLVQWCYYAGSAFDNTTNVGGSYLNTSFVSNNGSGDPRFCNGIALFNSQGPRPTTTGSTANPPPLICP